MRPRRFCIHVCGSSGPIFKTYLHVLLHFGYGIDVYLSQILYKNAFFWTFLKLHSSFCVFTKQIMNLFIVNFYKTATD